MAGNDLTAQVLVDALTTLKNPDGTLQESNRKLALGALLSELTASETIDFRLRLNALQRPGFPERLQAELYYKILDYISLDDAMNLRLVHLNWSRRFSSVEFCKEIVKRHFPAKYEDYENSAKILAEDIGREISSEGQALAESNLKEWLGNVVKTRRRRARGEYESTSVYYHPNGLEEPQYCNGRVAHVDSRKILVVKSLQSDWEERFAAPQRDYLSRWLLSDKYILAVNGDGHTIYAWSLETSESQFRDDPQMQHFPQAISNFTACGNRAGLVIGNNEIYIWNIGQLRNPSSRVDYPLERGYTIFHPRELTVILHPCKNRCYDTPSPKTQRKTQRSQLRFYKYEGLDITSRYTLYLNFTRSKTDDQTRPFINTLHDNMVVISDLCGFQQRISKQDSNIVETDMQMDDTNVYSRDIIEEFGPMNGSESDDMFFGLCGKERSLLLFHMDTGESQCRNYYEPGEDFSHHNRELQPESFIWREQTLSPIHRPDPKARSLPEGITGVLLTAVNHFQTIPCTQGGKIHWYSEDNNNPPRTAVQCSEPSEISLEQMTAFHWVSTPSLARAARPMNEREARHDAYEMTLETRRVRGDDIFVVLFGETGFVVWCFDPTVRLRTKDSNRDTNLPKNRPNPFASKFSVF